MTEKGMTRREILKFLGLEIPLVLVSTQVLTREAFGQSVTRTTFRLDREILLSYFDRPDKHWIEFLTVYDDWGHVKGRTINRVSEDMGERMKFRGLDLDNVVIRSIAGGNLDEDTDENLAAAFGRMRDALDHYEPVVVELEIDGEAYEYVFDYQ